MSGGAAAGPNATVRLLVTLVDDREPGYTRHAHSVARLARMVGLELGLSESALDHLRLAALLHDVGSLRLPFPHTGSRWHLPPEERRVYEGHPAAGARIVRMLELPVEVERAVLGHHERWNGTGYPRGASGAQISLEARIIGVCDVYDQALNGRGGLAYQGLTEEEAFQQLAEVEPERFDQQVVAALRDALCAGREIEALTGLL